MSKYWITFRIHYQTVDGRTYEQRYEALVKAIAELASLSWSEPTSFYVIESKYDLVTCATHMKKAIAESTDLVLIRFLDHQDALYCGVIHDNTIFSLMPYLKGA